MNIIILYSVSYSVMQSLHAVSSVLVGEGRSVSIVEWLSENRQMGLWIRLWEVAGWSYSAEITGGPSPSETRTLAYAEMCIRDRCISY